MVTTNDSQLADRIWSWKDHGRNRKLYGKPSNGHYKRVFDTLGTNARMTEVQAAIGREGLKQVHYWVVSRQLNAMGIRCRLRVLKAELRVEIPPKGNAAYRFYAYARSKAARNAVLAKAARKKVPLGVGSCPEIYLDKVFSSFRPKDRLPNARLLGETSIAFLVDPTQTDIDLWVAASCAS